MQDENNNGDKPRRYVIRTVNDFTSARYELSVSYLALLDSEVLGTAYLYGKVSESHIGLKVKSTIQGENLLLDLLGAVLGYAEMHGIQRLRTTISASNATLLVLLQSHDFYLTASIGEPSRTLVLICDSPHSDRSDKHPGDANQPS